MPVQEGTDVFPSDAAATAKHSWGTYSDATGFFYFARLDNVAAKNLRVAWHDAAGNPIGTPTNPVRTDPTGTTTQPVAVAALPLPAGAAAQASLALRHNAAASLAKAELAVGQELRFDDVSAGDLYLGRAPDGTATADAAWEVFRYYRTAVGAITRGRYRTGVAWDNRTAGW